MEYTRYMSSRNLAWETLLNWNVRTLPVRVSVLCRDMGIWVKLYNGQSESDGESMILSGQALILVSRQKPVQRQRFTAAHELGHILLGHVGEGRPAHRGATPEDAAQEREANIFASRLLAPACVLWGCRVRSVEDIMELCDISHQAAELRWRRIQELTARDRFLTSPLERRVFEQFGEFIREHRF